MIFSGTFLAQLGRGTLTGTLLDTSGAVVPGVAITIRNAEAGATYRTRTTGAGQYTMPTLPSGRYDLIFEAPGFNRLLRHGVELRVTEALRFEASPKSHTSRPFRLDRNAATAGARIAIAADVMAGGKPPRLDCGSSCQCRHVGVENGHRSKPDSKVRM